MFIIYALVDPRNGHPFYVGCTEMELYFRHNAHWNDIRVTPAGEPLRRQKIKIIKSIRRSGRKMEIKPLFICPYKDRAAFCEATAYELLSHAGYRLFNSPHRFYQRK